MNNERRASIDQFDLSSKETGLDLVDHELEVSLEQAKNGTEALRDEKVQGILPYLTLDKLNKQEISGLMELAGDVLTAMDLKKLPKDKFLTIESLEKAIAMASGEEVAWEKGLVPPKLAQAQKLVCARLLNEIDDDNPKKKWDIYNNFFGTSPDIASYCGGLRGSLELLTIAERTSQNPCANEIYEEIIYEYSFAEQNDFEKILHDSTPIQQLRLLPIYNKIALRCDTDSYSRRALGKVVEALDAIEEDDHSKPLIELVAFLVNDNIEQFFAGELVDIDNDNPECRRMLQEHEERQLIWKKEQEQLHEEFPTLPKNRALSRIAPDVAGASDASGNTVQISNQKGETLSLLNCLEDNTFGLDRDTAFLVGAAHNPGVEEIINNRINLKLQDIPLNSQVQLLKFMTEADSSRFNRLCNTLSKVDRSLRLKLTEGFVAADFGEDFGDALLDIASSERLSNDEKERVLDTISSCRESVGRITDLYTSFDDGKFAKQYARASNERLTDAVTVFQQIAKNGVAEANLDWAGKPRFDFDKAIEALEYEAKSLEVISGTLGDVKSGVKGAFAEVVLPRDDSLQRLNRTFYNFYSPQHGYVLLYTRPEGSHSFDPTIEFGKERSKYSEDSINAGVEASISLTTNPIDPFSLPNPYRPDKRVVKNPRFYDPIIMDKVSAIRLDREGRAPGMAANDSSRDPINPVGMVSVDLAAIGDRADTPSGKIARLLSVGGKLREEASGVDSSLNHNTRWFDQDSYGTADGFRDLVGYVDKMALKWCSESKPGNDAESFTKKMKQNRGKMARRVA